MALMDCPECGREVSDQAESCPRCAFPIAADRDSTRGPVEEVQTIEATGKDYKAQMAFGAVGVILGVVLLVVGSTNSSTGTMIAGATVGGTGLLVSIFGRVGAWWEHE